MKIIIKEENRKEIEKALAGVQKYSRARNVTADDVFKWKDKIEQKFDDVATYRLDGTIVTINQGAQKFANKYKGIPESTWLEIKKYPSGWAITNVYRGKCTQSESYVKLSEKTQEGILMNYQSI